MRSAFSLVELLIVIAIIGVLAGITVPLISSAQEAASRAECANHLRQVGVAFHLHADARRRFPHADYYAKLMPFVANGTASLQDHVPIFTCPSRTTRPVAVRDFAACDKASPILFQLVLPTAHGTVRVRGVPLDFQGGITEFTWQDVIEYQVVYHPGQSAATSDSFICNVAGIPRTFNLLGTGTTKQLNPLYFMGLGVTMPIRPVILDRYTGLAPRIVAAKDGLAHTLLLSHRGIHPSNYNQAIQFPDYVSGQVAIHCDDDVDANTNRAHWFWGTPHPRLIPSLFADGHVVPIAYPSLGAGEWRSLWTYDDYDQQP